ncbi:MAG: ribose-5-phosphate isomerase RpiA [Firmicutes bacterium]|jgi:ribose 5-phosphate isomerase A|nr:ribose-5-phosphate isomerase RpiA [Bacillota bacterium]
MLCPLESELRTGGNDQLKATSANVEAKRAAGRKAAEMVRHGMRVGAGTGSTAVEFIKTLVERVRLERLDVEVVPTSFQSRMLCLKSGLTVVDPAFVSNLDLCVDGADEVDQRFNAIKGGGACHTLEKVVAALADHYVLVIDESKLVTSLGQGFPVPIEVLPAALGLVTREVERMGFSCSPREGSGKDGPVVSDNGNLILDVNTGAISDPLALSNELDRIPGLVGHGLFVGMVDCVVVGRVREGEATADVLTL